MLDIELEKYANCIKGTLNYIFPKYLLKQFFQVIKDNKLTIDLDIEMLDFNKELIMILQDFEFNKIYRYSCILSYDKFDINILNEKIQKGIILTKDGNIYDNISLVISTPTLYQSENKHILKFSLTKGHTSVSDYKDSVHSEYLKYTVLVVIHEDIKVIEIRYDILPIKFRDTRNFYKEMIIQIRTWLEAVLEIKTNSYDMKINEKSFVSNEVSLSGISLRTTDGSKVAFDKGFEWNKPLPIIDRIKGIILQYQTKMISELKQDLEDLIIDIEELSDSQWCKLYFINFGVSLTINYAYGDTGLTTLTYSSLESKNGKEMMDYVIKYLVNCGEKT
ncbi:MAG: hypothetical protein FWC47_13260 [Oscillospiraceae bacterium]|nr:hypothetical protein [Oscillospiraceae bacterium]